MERSRFAILPDATAFTAYPKDMKISYYDPYSLLLQLASQGPHAHFHVTAGKPVHFIVAILLLCVFLLFEIKFSTYLYFCNFLWLTNLLLVSRSDSAVCRNVAHSECPEVLEDELSLFICVGPSGMTSILISFVSVYVMLISIWWACIQGGYRTTDG